MGQNDQIYSEDSEDCEKLGKEAMTPKERLLAVLNGQKVDRVPVAQPLQTGTVEFMESSGAFWPEAHSNPELMARLSFEAHKVAGFESVRVPFDVNVESEALGCVLDYDKGANGIDIQPSVRTASVDQKEDLAKLQIPDPQKDGRMPVVIEAVKLLKKLIEEEGSNIPIFAAVVAPFMVAGQIRGVDKLMRDLIKDPAFSHALLEKSYQTSLAYGQALVEAGADVIVMIDASASPDLISAKYFAEYAKPYSKRLAENLGVPTILHICGNTHVILDQMGEIANGVSIDSLVKMKLLKEVLGNTAAAVGNIDVNGTLLFGSAEEIAQSVRERIDAGVDILTTACGIGPRTPSQNLITMVQTAKEYGRQKK